MRRIEGYVIVSADGRIADASGVMPPSLRNDADQSFFQAALDGAAAIIHGRHSNEGGPRSARRKRLVMTRQVASLALDPDNPNVVHWNPMGATLDQALERLGVKDGTIAVIGGTEVFSLFLPLYDAFHLSHSPKVTIPGGLPAFNEVGPTATPEDVLARHGLKPGPRRDLDKAADVFVVTWQR